MEVVRRILGKIKEKHDHAMAWFSPSDQDQLSEKTTYYSNLFYLWLLSLACVPTFLLRFAYYDMTSVVLVLCLGGPLMMAAPIIYKKSRSLALTRELFILGLYSLNFSELLFFKGLVSSGLWFCTLPVIATLLGGLESAVIWLAIDLVTIVGTHIVYGNNLDLVQQSYPFWYQIYFESEVGLVCALTLFIVLGEVSRRKAFFKLEKAHEQIRELAVRDALTGIYNRRFIWEQMGSAERRAGKGEAIFSVCLMDLDKFKSINDTYGHAMGDAVLKTVASHIQSEIRSGDLCARYGGEEFLCLLNNTGVNNAYIFADRLRQSVSELQIDGLNVSISIGVAEYQVGEDFSKTVARADGALYQAKAQGRNRAVIA